MLDLSKFTKEQVEQMLEDRERLLLNMMAVGNITQIIEEIQELKDFLVMQENPKSDNYGAA